MDYISGGIFCFNVSCRKIGLPYGVLLGVLWAESGEPS